MVKTITTKVFNMSNDFNACHRQGFVTNIDGKKQVPQHPVA